MDLRVRRPLALALAAASALGLVVIAAYFIDPISRADGKALEGLSSLSLDHRWIWVANDALAHSVDLPFLVAGVALIFVAGLAWGRPLQAVAAVLLVAAANVLTQLLKLAAAHPRYQGFLGPHQLVDTAFPSGHATAAMSLAVAAIIVSPPGRRRELIAVVGGGLGLAVSLALVIQGWHYPSDVIGGFLVVGFTSMLVLAGLAAIDGRRLEHRADERRAVPELRAIGALALRLGTVMLAAVAALLLATHPGAVASYAAEHTTAVVAALGIALAALGLVSGVAGEMEESSG